MLKRNISATLIVLLLVVGLFSTCVFAQDEGGLVSEEERKAAEQPKEITDPYVREYIDGKFIRIVERGFYIRSTFGYSLFFGDVREQSPDALAFGLTLGYDILEKWLQFDIGVLALSADANIDKDADGLPDDMNAKVSGSHMTLMALGTVRGTYLVHPRVLVRLNVGGGVAYDDGYIKGFNDDYTKKEVADLGGAVGGGLGVEYFTRLRHFSVSLDLDFYYLLAPSVPVFNILPALKYTF